MPHSQEVPTDPSEVQTPTLKHVHGNIQETNALVITAGKDHLDKFPIILCTLGDCPNLAVIFSRKGQLHRPFNCDILTVMSLL